MTRVSRTTAATLVAFAALAATAFAWFAGSGAGAGSGSATASREVVISAGATPSPSLLPTGEYTGDVTVTLTNPTSKTLTLRKLVLDTSRGDEGYGTEGLACQITYRERDNGGAGWSLAPGTNELTLTGAVKMATTAPSTCQGTEIRVFLKAA